MGVYIMISSFIGSIILLVIGLFILYVVISKAVRDGIDQSVVGDYFKQKKVSDETFPPRDLDNE